MLPPPTRPTVTKSHQIGVAFACVLPDNVRSIASRMSNADLLWGTGAQIDFYDQQPHVDYAANAAAEHFRAHLPRS